MDVGGPRRDRGRNGQKEWGGYATATAFKAVPKTRLRARLRAELELLGKDPLVIIARGRAIAVVVTVDRWNQMQDEFDELHATVRLLRERFDVLMD